MVNTGQAPDPVLAHAGYCSVDNVGRAAKFADEHGTDFFIATGRRRRDDSPPIAPRGRIPKSALGKQRVARASWPPGRPGRPTPAARRSSNRSSVRWVPCRTSNTYCSAYSTGPVKVAATRRLPQPPHAPRRGRGPLPRGPRDELTDGQPPPAEFGTDPRNLPASGSSSAPHRRPIDSRRTLATPPIGKYRPTLPGAFVTPIGEAHSPVSFLRPLRRPSYGDLS